MMHRDKVPSVTLDLLIHKALACMGPWNEYEVARRMEEVSKEVVQVKEESLYPALQCMLMKGWVKANWGATAGDRRARYNKLTPPGRKQLAVEVSQFKRAVEGIARAIQMA